MLLGRKARTVLVGVLACKRRCHGPIPFDHDAGHRIDPGEMVFNALHPWNVLCRDDRRLPLAFIENRAPELDHAIAHDDVKRSGWCPTLALNPIIQPLAYGAIIKTRWRGLVREACQCM